MEQEEKVNIAEASVNLSWVKKELDEEEVEFDENQYQIPLTFENVFGESAIDQKSNRDGLIGFLDGDIIIMEIGSVKLEDVKEENEDLRQETIEQSYCNKCDGNYQGYCLNCSSLSHILNNLTPNLNSEPILNTTPINVLEIREVSSRRGVFALRTLPKGIILGPFEGIAPIESTTRRQWKIKDRKFVNDQNGNWMKYIESVANHASKNLDVFQLNGILYFETSREIQDGEELLVCYCIEAEVLKSKIDEEFYLVPVKKEEFPKVFACTLCCLGFRLKRCLVEHKSKCPFGGSIGDFELIQCRCCKVWLEKQEHLEGHMLLCLENYNRLCNNIPNFHRKSADEIDESQGNGEVSAPIDENRSHLNQTEVIQSKQSDGIRKAYKRGHVRGKKHKCSECSYQTKRKYLLKSHLKKHKDIKQFKCDICEKIFNQKGNLKTHIINQHLNKREKKYECSECSYHTISKHLFKLHLNIHIEPFECYICKMIFNLKRNLKKHIINQHLNTSKIEYKCSKCSYQTNHKNRLKSHLSTHQDIKEFECDICKKIFNHKTSLRLHIRYLHSNTMGKEYKCSECSYKTNRKTCLKTHLHKHKPKSFECDICKKRFSLKDGMKRHKKYQHLNTSEKEYKCFYCSYQSNYKHHLVGHLNTHNDIKPFECDICKKGFNYESSLRLHIRSQHSNTNEKEYKCSECSYQTNLKGNLTVHFNIHTNIKSFECGICKKKFTQTSSLNVHIRSQHSNTTGKDYKYKSHSKANLSTDNDIKRFECDICNKRFTQKSSLNVHIRSQHSNTMAKEYKCSECSYQTHIKGNFAVHLNIHNNITPFECDFCKKRFNQKGSLKLHIENKHSNTSDNEYK